jgi:hypothetical protein
LGVPDAAKYSTPEGKNATQAQPVLRVLLNGQGVPLSGVKLILEVGSIVLMTTATDPA